MIPPPASVPGTGLFTGLQFHPVVPSLTKDNYIVRDLTLGPPPPLADTGFAHDVGRYNERRPAMYTTDLFGATAADDIRDIHVGVDIGGSVGTPVCCLCDGVVHSSGYNPAAGDYGHVIVIESYLAGRRVWALYGHLSASSIRQETRTGQQVNGGQIIGWLGDEKENGGWPPHVHFQLSLKEPTTHDMPGVVSRRSHEQALRDFPDPRMVLGPLYEGEGLFEA